MHVYCTNYSLQKLISIFYISIINLSNKLVFIYHILVYTVSSALVGGLCEKSRFLTRELMLAAQNSQVLRKEGLLYETKK
jgi:hypothetical protein